MLTKFRKSVRSLSSRVFFSCWNNTQKYNWSRNYKVFKRFEHNCLRGSIYEFCGPLSTCLHCCKSPPTPWSGPACHISLHIKSEGEETALVLSSSKDNKGQSDLVGRLLLILAMGTSPHLGCTICFPEGSSPTSEDFYTSLKVMHD